MKRGFCYLFLTLFLSCHSDEKPYSETVTINIQGKPVNVFYTYQGYSGSLTIRYEGSVHGKVGACYIAVPQGHPDSHFDRKCPWVDTLSGDLANYKQRFSYEREMDAGEFRSVRLTPESREVSGKIKIHFIESPVGSF